VNIETTFVKRHNQLFLIIFFILTAYHIIGIFPIAPIEGDGIATANGALHASSIGLGPNPLTYSYHGRSGTYF